ncbi:hypothetical protein AMTRI_Chr11g158440 [Amborella trichopoda]
MGGQKRQRDGEGGGEGEGEGGEEEEEAEERGGFHALVVDDCPIDRKIVERLLKTGFSKVTAVDSGRRALKVLGFSEHNHESPPGPACKVDIILTDYCMPEMSGYDLLALVKGNKGMKDIPVVMMSSENVPQRIRSFLCSCLAIGAEEFILKPLRLGDVMKLRNYIRPLAPVPKTNSKRKVPSDRLPEKGSERQPHLTGVAEKGSERQPHLTGVAVA